MPTLYLAPEPRANDFLRTNPYALLIGMLLDQQIPMERAFSAPFALAERLALHGLDFEPCVLARLDPEILGTIFGEKPALHRFPKAMAQKAQGVSEILCTAYGGSAEALYTTASTGSELLQRLKALPGFGTDKAKIFLALLAKRQGIRLPGWVEASDPFGGPGFHSVADSGSPEDLTLVRQFKAEMKAAAKR